LKEAMEETAGPVVVDVIVTRDPAQMLPGVDAGTASKMTNGDRLI
jgi:acetolactate synthase-1/2/3 large subunit